ncbi:MAG: nuclear transport factor 2 family protein [Hyphomonadaceae bacterium]|nr:nuclear transport factor 2 family protein [Hyphomonadaceae bacterium]
MPTNKDIITAIFAETAKGNGRPYVEALADDAVWIARGANSWSGVYRGKTAILEDIFGRLREKLDGRNTCVPSRIHADGDFVIVEAKGQNQLKDGQRYDNEYCFVIRMRDGKMIEITEYLDTELVSARLGERV